MFPYGDPQFQLDLHNQHAAELRKEATFRRLGRAAAHQRRGLFHRRPRPDRAPMAP
jgi:hypothetical protein